MKFPLDRLEVLSIGTAGRSTFVKDPQSQGLAGWATQIADLLLNAQMSATNHYLEYLLEGRFLRIDDPAPRVEDLGDASEVGYLIGRGKEIGAARWQDVKNRFINGIPAQDWRRI